MTRRRIFFGLNRDSGRCTHRSRSSGCDAFGSFVEDARILLGTDLDDRHRSIYDPSPDAGVATSCGDCAGSGAGRGAGYVLQSECMGLCTGYSFVRIAGLDVARGRRLPFCSNYVEYYFADSAGTRPLDHWMASVSGSVPGNCGGAGGDYGVAPGEENGLIGPQD
jgi:hypothetical protein